MTENADRLATWLSCLTFVVGLVLSIIIFTSNWNSAVARAKHHPGWIERSAQIQKPLNDPTITSDGSPSYQSATLKFKDAYGRWITEDTKLPYGVSPNTPEPVFVNRAGSVFVRNNINGDYWQTDPTKAYHDGNDPVVDIVIAGVLLNAIGSFFLWFAYAFMFDTLGMIKIPRIHLPKKKKPELWDPDTLEKKEKLVGLNNWFHKD